MKRFFGSRDYIRGFRLTIALSAAVLVVLLISRFDVRALLDAAQSRPEWGIPLTMALYIGCSVLLLPGSIVITVATGALYGFGAGVLVIWAAAVAAAALSFGIGRTVLPKRLKSRLQHSRRFSAIDAGVKKDGVKITLALRLSPIFPARTVNYLLSVTSIPFRDYALGSAIGIFPFKAFIVFLGADLHGATEDSRQAWYFLTTKIIGILVFVIAALYTSVLAKRFLAEMSVGQRTPSR